MAFDLADFEAATKSGAEADKELLVKFYTKSVPSEAKTREMGMPGYEPVEYVCMIRPGAKKPIFDNPARDSDRARFPRQYQAFLQRKEIATEGTPLEHWPMMSRELVESYKSVSIFTIEQLAGLSDGVVGNIFGARDLQKKAKVWLALAKDTAVAQKLAVENDEQKAELARLREQVRELDEEVKRLTKDKKRQA